MTDNEIISIDEAIRHCYETYFERDDLYRKEHKQLAKWLEELKESHNTINRQAAEIIRLKGSVVTNNIMEIARVKKEAKSEVIKEFAKRVKTKAKMYNAEDVEEGDLIDDLLTVGEIVEIIDNLVKEMTEGK